MPSQPISFGILLHSVQALDLIGPMDVLSNLGPQEVSHYGPLLPDVDMKMLSENTMDIKFHYPGPSTSPVRLSGNFYAVPSCDFDNCPKLDYLLIGGTDPQVSIEPGRMPESVREFIRARAPECKIVFTTCTGALTLAPTGLLDGLEATVNHVTVAIARTVFPNVRWNAEKNWVEGEKFWTSSGAVAGMDMILHWVKQVAGPEIADLTTMLLDYQPRDVDGRRIRYVDGSGNRV